MKISTLGIEGAWIATTPVWADDRGSFREWFKSTDIASTTGLDFSVAQANISQSKRGVVRGIHYSLALRGPAKWVTCVTGGIKDVVIDIRQSSPTYGKYVSVDLVGGDGRAVFISNDLGHGFVSMVEGSTVAYLITSPFSPTEEFEINPLDPEIGIDWGIPFADLKFSEKDKNAPSLKERGQQGRLPS